MAVIADDLRAGFVDVVRNEKRMIVAYVTGALLIVAGTLFDDQLHFKGFPMTIVGGVLIALAIFVPFVTTRMTAQPDLTEIYSTMHDALASQREEHAMDLREVRHVIGEIRAQLR